MADKSAQELKTPHTLASGEDQDNDSRHNIVEEVKERSTKRKASTHEGPSRKKVKTDDSTHTLHFEGASVRGSKRKAQEADEERPNKKIRGSDHVSITEPSSVVFEGVKVRQSERKAHDDGDRASNKSSDLSPEISACSSSLSDEEETYDLSFTVKTNRAEFEGNYYELSQLGEGGFGAVYEGYRKNDMAPVAIKHIRKEKVLYKEVVQNGEVFQVIEEVALMVKAAGGADSPGKTAAISLLDCFDLEEELILVVERPVPSMDLHKYRRAKGGYLQEHEAKIILKQMIDAAIEMHSNGVFHRDIKLQNVLVETGPIVPRVRVIDFGCGCLVRKRYYNYYCGTFSKAPPEWFVVREYQAIPTTVWQLGALLWDLLDRKHSFKTQVQNGEVFQVIEEVALMVKAAGGADSPGKTAAISLLDCFDLEEELILVVERPVPSMDLHKYRRAKGGYLQEHEAKVQNGEVFQVIEEVALMVKAAGGADSPGKTAAISLLDCFDLEEELILVVERPVPSMDLHKYRRAKGGYLQEHEAKIILKQMIHAAIEMHSNSVFHRDIKLQNVLVETGPTGPRVRVIDFGCGCLVRKRYYNYYCGTFSKAPPEWFVVREYQAIPTTVWQLGALLWDLLDRKHSFKTQVQNGEVFQVIEEVALMVKAAGGADSPGKTAAISLLDCFDLEEELILVVERPVPSMDLHKYRRAKGGYLQEHEAKIILKQMIDAAIEMHSNSVFHRDIKLQNVLVETGPTGPRVRVIDFGCGCLVRKRYYNYYCGTFSKAPPEWFVVREYQAIPTTVWQLGALLWDLLDRKHSFKTQVQNGEVFQVIEEVALMVKAAGGADSPGKTAAISLLDCFDLEEELILVVERPVPSMDLHKYRRAKGGYLQEHEAKIILKQMIDAAIEMHSNGVFHRDIKLQNVLVETGPTGPRVRVIDFGCGCLVRKRYYNYYCGTFSKAPPEWFVVREYQAIPTTVWQLGALLWDLLDRKHSFKTQVYFQEGLKINKNLSRNNDSRHNIVEEVKERSTKRKASTHEGPSRKKVKTDDSTHTPHFEGASVRGSKRKAQEADEERPNKKIRGSDHVSITEPSSVVFEGVKVRQSERKAHDDGDRASNKSSDLSPEISACSSSLSDEEETYDLSFTVKTNRAEFEGNYYELSQLGEGGFGAVYEGYRKNDMAPVAIKHIRKEKVLYKEVVHNGEVFQVIEEVALMVKAAGGADSPGKTAAISLLDCFDLEEELILVVERPVPSMDLHKYRRAKGGYLQEHEAKIILKQMIDAAIEMHSNGVFHRDIKLQNVLVETGPTVPRVRVIDFGCGCLVRKRYYNYYCGTFSKAPPEWFLVREYQAIPTTVWQLGALLWDLLDRKHSFKTQVQNGEVFQVIEEVALMVKAAGGADSPGKTAAISLLDCFDLEEELILVVERPVPSMDLHKYRRAKGGYLQEHEAKIILKQMIDAAIEMHSNGVFHRDIKLQNVLVETGPTGPRVRVIDFGCGCLVRKRYYNYYCGTFSKAPPEWFLVREYQAIPTTVWQLGALLWDLLDRKHSFKTQVQNGEVFQVIEEVALMVKAAGGADSPGKTAAISLLDCFDLEEELILVVERPVPSMDLHKYRRAKGGYLQEHEAKIILKQMIHAAIEMHSNGVFHRDIKLQNILVETGPTGPRVRVIDFGCGCLVRKRYYNYYCGMISGLS
ncbi:hypothetical protein ABVT39_015425 [Epinephelus coioides]